MPLAKWLKASEARLKEMDSRQRKRDGFVSLFAASLKVPRTDIDAIKEKVKVGRGGDRKNVEEDDDSCL